MPGVAGYHLQPRQRVCPTAGSKQPCHAEVLGPTCSAGFQVQSSPNRSRAGFDGECCTAPSCKSERKSWKSVHEMKQCSGTTRPSHGWSCTANYNRHNRRSRRRSGRLQSASFGFISLTEAACLILRQLSSVRYQSADLGP